MQFDVANSVAVLERTPATFRALLSGLPEAWPAQNEGPETFSAFDNIVHLQNAERTNWIPRARPIVAQGMTRQFGAFDRVAQLNESRGGSMTELLDEFSRVRARNLATLADWQLSEQELQLAGEHPALGSIPVGQLLAAWVAHDPGHPAQTARVLAKQYGEAVGPWREYLPVLDR